MPNLGQAKWAGQNKAAQQPCLAHLAGPVEGEVAVACEASEPAATLNEFLMVLSTRTGRYDLQTLYLNSSGSPPCRDGPRSNEGHGSWQTRSQAMLAHLVRVVLER